MDDTGHEQRPRLGACDWCGKEAHQRLVLIKGRRLKGGWREQTAVVCDDHARHFRSQDEIGTRAETGW